MTILFGMLLAGSAAAEQLTVNKAEWGRLSEQDQRAIEKILQDTKLNADIVFSTDTSDVLPPSEFAALQDVPPQSADWWKKVVSVVRKNACEVGCDAAGLGAVSACGALSGGTVATVCGGLVLKARPVCKKAC